MDPLKAAKKRKLTDKAVPDAFLQLPEFAEDSQMYQNLLETERRLDWTMMRKKVEVQDALSRNPTTTRTLRMFLSHTVSGQIWQVGESSADGAEPTVNFETGQGIPAWALKIEGRLLEIPNQRSRDRVPPRKFSTFIKRMVVELERDPALYPDGNIMEWPRAPNSQPPLDGFTVRRTGDQPTRIRIIMHLEQMPEQYKVSPDLGNILGIKEDSRIGVIHTLWNYIKIHGLQDKVDRRRIRADDSLRPIFGGDGIAFQQLPELVNRYLMPPDPIVLHYSINPGVAPPERPMAWDIEVKMEDTSLKSRMAAVIHTSKESAQDLAKLDDEIALLTQSLHNAHTKRNFLQEFADDPAQFIQKWLASQSRDLESILGSGPSEGATIRAEELRRSDFFRLPWVEEAVAVQEGRQLGKLRQWAGEKISSRDKTIVTDEFKEIEQDIDLRKEGIIQLQAASEAYQHALSKKKESSAVQENEKLMPLDALGIVMIMHGEEFGDDSAFGTSLVKMGRAHCKVATIQEAYALTFQDTFIASCEHYLQDIKDYEHQRKKLESRRLSYDAAITKLEKIKTSKKDKEKEKKEAEDELQSARLRYEETSEDVRARMQSIQENEIQQLRELTTFLDLELNFVRQYHEVLKDVKSNWCTESTLTKFENQRANSRTHVFPRPTEEPSPNPLRSKRSTLSTSSAAIASSNDSDEEPISRRNSQRKSDAGGKETSRPISRASRNRSDISGVTDVGETAKADKGSKRMSVTGWASGAVSTITGRGKKDRDNFAALGNDGIVHEVTKPTDHPRSPSSRSISRKSPSIKSREIDSSPKVPIQILKPPSLQDKKLVRALYDFSGSSDELSFRAGDEITVINEVLDDWWLGALNDGRKGLFPTSYIESATKSSKQTSPNIPSSRGHSPYSSEGFSHREDDSDDDVEKMLRGRPLEQSHSGYVFDTESVTSTVAEEEEEARLMPPKSDDEEFIHRPMRSDSPQLLPPSITSKRSDPGITIKRPPPPPPPRRSTNTLKAPPLPERTRRSQSNSPLPKMASTPASSYNSPHGVDVSPFDSLMDVSARCTEFEQHPHERRGMCSDCFQLH
ncbi:BAR-domain-containing protein [Hygrophoropsis aurantiaca]|uniref:BAR-domain-containing protein n=1 Tax=Hygrophoropsis aurantiaca TaxID=72124 RepID=A0ACB8A0M5_9AGAM|nr:BAR-domain-containing protein [Hygrophoropsis aurantiaca]